MIEIKNLHSGYRKENVLCGVDLLAEKGTITTILGVNGSGKSTLFKTMIGALPIRHGEITVSGKRISEMSRTQLAKEVAYLSQCKNQPDMTVGKLVLHGRFPHLCYPRRYTSRDREIAAAAMKKMEISHLEHLPLAELSGGMRQRAYIAMILAQQTSVILMDEPTSYLDLGQQVKFAQLARELVEQGKTLLLVLHDILLALKLSDQIVVMDKGVAIASGTPKQILNSGVLTSLYGVSVGCADGQYYYCID